MGVICNEMVNYYRFGKYNYVSAYISTYVYIYAYFYYTDNSDNSMSDVLMQSSSLIPSLVTPATVATEGITISN